MTLPGTITTARLTGRRLTAGDLEYVIETDSDPRIQMPIFGRVHTAQESQGRLGRWLQVEREHGLGFFLFDDHEGVRVGHAGLFPSRLDPPAIEVGYALKPEHWGHGYATEMTVALVDLAFRLMDVQRIISITIPENHASRRVMEKSGLTFETQLAPEGAGPCVRYAIDRERWRLRT